MTQFCYSWWNWHNFLLILMIIAEREGFPLIDFVVIGIFRKWLSMESSKLFIEKGVNPNSGRASKLLNVINIFVSRSSLNRHLKFEIINNRPWIVFRIENIVKFALNNFHAIYDFQHHFIRKWCRKFLKSHENRIWLKLQS